MYEYQGQSTMETIITRLAVSLVEFLGSVLLAYFVVVTFGASLVDDFESNLAFSAFVATICTMPAFLLIPHKNPLDLMIRLFVYRDLTSRFERILVGIAHGCVVGAWFGALVIPLDWDRWWQQWPVSCSFGAIFGAIGAFVYYTILKKRKDN